MRSYAKQRRNVNALMMREKVNGLSQSIGEYVRYAEADVRPDETRNEKDSVETAYSDPEGIETREFLERQTEYGHAVNDQGEQRT